MKQLKPVITLPLAILLLCAWGPCATIQPGNDSVLVNAERTTAVAYDTFDTFFALERRQEAIIKENAPEVHTFANTLRRNAPKYLASARAATEAYRTHRDPANKATLQTAIAVLQEALNQVQYYTAEIPAKAK